MNMQYKVTGAQIFSTVSDVAIRHARIWVIAVGFMAAVSTALDIALKGEMEALAGITSSFLNFFISYRVAEVILRDESLLVTPNRHYGSLFGASILTTLGAGLGFILLIVPGLYCMARWSLVTPLIVAEGKAAGEALSESWRRTRENAWVLVSVYLVYAVAFGVLIALLGFSGMLASDDQGDLSLYGAGIFIPFVANLASIALGMVGTLISIAIYRELAGSASAYNDVFS